MSLKIGDKVRNIHDHTEGYVTYSQFGASVVGWIEDNVGNKIHFQTLGTSLKELEKDWEKIDKFIYNMSDHN